MSGLWDDRLFAIGETEIPKRRRKRVNHKKLEAMRFVKEHKEKVGCLHCKIKDPTLLDFHHLEPEKKLYNISEMVKRGMAIDLILDEMAKCIVLCSNCHRKVEGVKNEIR